MRTRRRTALAAGPGFVMSIRVRDAPDGANPSPTGTRHSSPPRRASSHDCPNTASWGRNTTLSGRTFQAQAARTEGLAGAGTALLGGSVHMSRRLGLRRGAPLLAVALALGAIVAGPGVQAQGPPGLNHHPVLPPTGGRPKGLSLGLFGGRPIKYHGGPVMLGTTHAYAIWYGNWPTTSAYPATPALMASFLGNDGGSPYFNINTTYNNCTTAVSNSVAFGGAAYIGYDGGKTTLNDSDVANEVT